MSAQGSSQLSEKSRRIAKNTVFLYFRMLLMLFIGLFTSRVIVKSLGFDDYGIYNAVGGIVAVFTFLTNATANSISRFLAYEQEKGDSQKLKRVFATSMTIQIVISLLLIVLIETIGMWSLTHKMSIPDGRMTAASFVLHTTAAILLINLISVPFNSSIIAHEKMGAYAYISIFEGVMKLAVAGMLFFSPFDKLKTYGVLMLSVSLLIRFTYGVYCHRHFEETRFKFIWDKDIMREMFGFIGWNFYSSSAMVFNTQGLNIVSNVFFGVTINAARGIAGQVEGMVRPFLTNLILSFTPQITKSYAAGDHEYCTKLVLTSTKYIFLIMMVFLIPIAFESETMLHIWLGEIPEKAALFTKLGILCMVSGLVVNPAAVLLSASGKIKRYSILAGTIAYLVIPVSLIAFRSGAPAESSYAVFFIIYLIVDVLRVVMLRVETGFSLGPYWRGISRLCLVALCSLPAPYVVWSLLPVGFWRLVAVCAAAWASLAAFTWAMALDKEEKHFVTSRLNSLFSKPHHA